MKLLIAMAVCGLAILSGQEAGWKVLFDGKTMKGWHDPRTKTPPGDAWSIEDGCLKAKAKPAITEDLFSKETFADFELMYEWRIAPGGNSGVKYRIQDHLFLAPEDPVPGHESFEARVERSFQQRVPRTAKGQDYVIGFEYQMTDDSKNGDALGNAKHTAGALYDMVAPSTHAAKTAGEWNTTRILLRGVHVEHWLNGTKVVDGSLDSTDAMEGIRKRWTASPHVFELMSKQPKRACQISLQNHGDEAWFRNIKIRRL